MMDADSNRVLSLDQAARYRSDGYLHVPQLVSRFDISRVKAMIYRLYRSAVPNDKELDQLEAPWDTERFDQKLATFRERDRSTFGALYDSAQNNIATVRMLLSEDAIQACADALAESPENLSCSGLLLRMDPPHDKRNVLEWHQDRAFFPQNFDGSNGVVLTILMSDTDENMGALEICPRSHTEKYHPPKLEEKKDYTTSEQRTIDADLVKKYPTVNAVGALGDAYLLHMNTFHRSGENQSARIRFSAIMRFHRMFADDYVPYRWVEKFNENVRNKIDTKFAS